MRHWTDEMDRQKKQFDILRNAGKDPDGTFSKKIASYLVSHGTEARIIEDGIDVSPSAACLIVLGGDGTVLRAARRVGGRIPLIGINLGSLGYLAEISRNAVYPALDQLIGGVFRIEDRMMLKGAVYRNGQKIKEGIALNDIVISRKGPLQILRFENYVNNEALSAFFADGIIISSPTGSTGYSMSAGGPIVSPSASLLLMTPVASHTIGSRSIIFADSDVIRIEMGVGRYDEAEECAEISFDGEDELLLNTGDAVEITKNAVCTQIIKLENQSFLETLRVKMQYH